MEKSRVLKKILRNYYYKFCISNSKYSIILKRYNYNSNFVNKMVLNKYFCEYEKILFFNKKTSEFKFPLYFSLCKNKANFITTLNEDSIILIVKYNNIILDVSSIDFLKFFLLERKIIYFNTLLISLFITFMFYLKSKLFKDILEKKTFTFENSSVRTS